MPPPTTTRETPELHIGDRIQLVHPIIGVAAGTRGCVLRCYTFDPLYDICFDGYAAPRLVNKRDVTAALSE
jgi:hypothetical protein